MNFIHSDVFGRTLLADMIEAVQRTMTENWVQAQPFVEMESRHVLDSLGTIARLKENGVITEDQAKLQLAIQKEAFQSLLLTIEGIHRVQAENAVNAALSVIRTAVNGMLGWSLL